ncbi:MAG: archease [Gammaproteobacteria bacterium]|nr:archease [Gammaproteobacteria bacterium]
MPPAHWQHFEHEADIGIRGYGNSQAEAFVQAAHAMMAVITEPALIQPRHLISIECDEQDPELLLVDWLNSLIFQMSTRKMLFSRFELELDGSRLQARVWGEAVDTGRHQPSVEIKGATYTELSVKQQDGEWIAQCVVDV